MKSIIDWLWKKTTRRTINSAAKLTAIQLGLTSKEDKSYWMRMDFVELTADFHQVVMLGNHHICFDREPLEKLHAVVKPLIESQGVSYFAQENYALIRSEKPFGFFTKPSHDFLGEAVHAYLPTDKAWVQVMHEAQMLIQQLKPVIANVGDSFLINSIWFSGDGNPRFRAQKARSSG